MTLNEFKDEMIDALERFSEYYKTSHAVYGNKFDWPLEMNEQEWLEQFLIWCESGEPEV